MKVYERDVVRDIGRIAAALERIAAALEDESENEGGD